MENQNPSNEIDSKKQVNKSQSDSLEKIKPNSVAVSYTHLTLPTNREV